MDSLLQMNLILIQHNKRSEQKVHKPNDKVAGSAQAMQWSYVTVDTSRKLAPRWRRVPT